jgi:cbb3-type cytochrome oxidase maturation protein
VEAIYLLIPLAALLVVIIVAGFLWAVRSGQFDDLEGPAYSILMDDEDDTVRTRPDVSERHAASDADDEDRPANR